MALWCLHVEQRSSLQFTCNFHLFVLFTKNCGYFLQPLFTYPTAQHKLWTRKSRCVTGRFFNLFTSNAKHFCMVAFHAFSAPYKCDGNSPQECIAFFPAIISNLHITAGACHIIHEYMSWAHAHFILAATVTACIKCVMLNWYLICCYIMRLKTTITIMKLFQSTPDSIIKYFGCVSSRLLRHVFTGLLYWLSYLVIKIVDIMIVLGWI